VDTFPHHASIEHRSVDHLDRHRKSGPHRRDTAQLDAVYEHGLAYARSQAFYNTTLFWQWMRMPGDIVFALAALLMVWDFIIKLPPFFPHRLAAGPAAGHTTGGSPKSGVLR
jgi:hypothetical protein